MARFLFVTWEGGGNVNPVLALGRRLLERGHDVAVFGSASLEPKCATAGFGFTAVDPAREWDQAALAEDVASAIKQVGPDALIVDYMQPGALCAAEASRVPTAAFVHTLYGGMMVNGDLMTMYMAANVDHINGVRESLGLPAVERLGDLLDRCARVVVTCPQSFDAPVDELKPNVVYVGPVLESAPPGTWDGEQPDVVVSLGTTAMDEGPMLQRVLDAVVDVDGRVVATVGDHLDPAAFTAPANATVSRYVPHAAVLPGAKVLVCHAGLGGILAALSYGVPVLAIPLGRDQPANAAAVERAGVGRSLSPDASADDIRAAITALMTDGARDLRQELAAYADAPVTAIEALLA